MSEGEVKLSTIEERVEAWRQRQDELLAPLVAGINEELDEPYRVRLEWKKTAQLFSSYRVAVFSLRTGKALSVYMNPDTMRRRLEFMARVLGAEPQKVEGYL